MESILSLLIFIPILSAILLFLLPFDVKFTRYASFTVTLFTTFLSLWLYNNFEDTNAMQFVESYAWIKEYGISYHIGIDGISLIIIMITNLIMPLLYLSFWHLDRKGYWLNLLIVHGGLTGAALALDLILFYVFWETMLLPIFFLIGLFGRENKNFMSMKFTLYTIFGSLMMLLAILYLGHSHNLQFNSWSFSIMDLKKLVFDAQTTFFLFAAFIFAFSIKIPLFPFHTWLPQTYRAAPIGAIVVMSALMAKLGVYAIWRFVFTLFEETAFKSAPFFVALGLFGMIYFGLAAMKQRELKKLFAYSSASHLSLIVMGIFTFNYYAHLGAFYMIASHAFSSAALFMMLGMIYKRTQSLHIHTLGGIVHQAPIFSAFFAFFALSIVGIPLTGGFVSELLLIIGAFKFNIFIGFIAATTLLIAVLFVFRVMQKVLYGKVKLESFAELRFYELLSLIPLALLIIVMGIFPSFFLHKFKPTAKMHTSQESAYDRK
ncbi:NADH-quinone oxidoreductase subunit M [Sulfurimonas sp. MAG313]|nr:NADH-quinone oxidoreductase subunit M [Sulfurimonas sp. MAG313]MDF1880867.1 NADH-quinone oxidoreductase subunit M [Sulfurimonas sp. MAG313]